MVNSFILLIKKFSVSISMRMSISIFLCLLLLPISLSAEASSNGYFAEHAKGWHWYDDPKIDAEEDDGVEEEQSDALKKEKQKQKESDKKNGKEQEKSPTEEMAMVREKIENALNKAVLYPNHDNVKNYITLQNQITERASQFQHYWQSVLLQSPDLDFSVMHPTSNLAKQAELTVAKNKEEAIIRELAKKSGLFFFYRSSCIYCQRFAPIVKDFAETYGITVIPITTDGVSLPEFPNSQVNRGQAEQRSLR